MVKELGLKDAVKLIVILFFSGLLVGGILNLFFKTFGV
jgi:hypothetical protein